LDNILIYSNNLVDYKKHVKEVLRRLRDNWLYTLLTKYIFYQDKVEFLDFVLELDGLRIDESEIQTIQDWPTPHRVKDV